MGVMQMESIYLCRCQHPPMQPCTEFEQDWETKDSRTQQTLRCPSLAAGFLELPFFIPHTFEDHDKHHDFPRTQH
jgi:hypothetical protein